MTVRYLQSSIFYHNSVFVTAKPTEPILLSPLSEAVDTHEGQQISLSTKISSEPGLHITWLKNGTPVKSDSHTKITSNKDGTQTLTIRSAKQEDSGEYSVSFKNDVGETITTSKVFVDRKPKTPAFKKRLPATSAVVERENVEYIVVVDGHPKPALTWLFKNAEVLDDEKVKVEETEEGKYHVVIQSCELSDKGTLKCTATNKSGSIHCSTSLTVKLGPPLVTVRTDSDVAVDQGQNAMFEIELPSDGGKYKVDWLKGTKPIFRSTKKYEIAHTGQVYTFTVVDAQESDKGTFKCVVSGPGGKTTKEFKLEIKG